MLTWNNGKEVPRWGVDEIQKMSPSTTGRCKYSMKWGQPTNGSAARRHSSQSHGFAVRVWSNLWELIWLRTSHYSMWYTWPSLHLLCSVTLTSTLSSNNQRAHPASAEAAAAGAASWRDHDAGAPQQEEQRRQRRHRHRRHRGAASRWVGKVFS